MWAAVQFLRQSAEPWAAPPMRPVMAWLMDSRAVKAQARFPRRSSVCGSILLAFLRSGQECCSPSTLEISSTFEVVVFFLSFCQCLWGPRPRAGDNGSGSGKPRLVTAHGSFEAFCPSRGTTRDNAARKRLFYPNFWTNLGGFTATKKKKHRKIKCAVTGRCTCSSFCLHSQ